MNEIPIPKNTNIIISIYAANRNLEIWGPDSYEWKPERWLNPLPETVTSARIPGIYSNLYVLAAFAMLRVQTNRLPVWPFLVADERACESFLSRNMINLVNPFHAFSGFKFTLLEMSQPDQPKSLLSWFWIFHLLEVVLCLLIESFRFSPSGKEVVWNMAALAIPTVPSSGSSTPQLPLCVEKVAWPWGAGDLRMQNMCNQFYVMTSIYERGRFLFDHSMSSTPAIGLHRTLQPLTSALKPQSKPWSGDQGGGGKCNPSVLCRFMRSSWIWKKHTD